MTPARMILECGGIGYELNISLTTYSAMNGKATGKLFVYEVIREDAHLLFGFAERIEREAKERAELVYFQANSVLTEASAKVDGISADITEMADKVMSQLTQLQVAVSSSKQALQDASSIMGAIRPNK